MTDTRVRVRKLVRDLADGDTYVRLRQPLCGLPAGTFTVIGVGEPFTARVNGRPVLFAGVREHRADRPWQTAVFNPVPALLEVEVLPRG